MTIKRDGSREERRGRRTLADEHRYRPTEQRDGPCSQGTLNRVGDLKSPPRRLKVLAFSFVDLAASKPRAIERIAID